MTIEAGNSEFKPKIQKKRQNCRISAELSDNVGKGKMGAYAMKRVAAGAHLPTPWLFVAAKRPDDKADCCLDYSFLP